MKKGIGGCRSESNVIDCKCTGIGKEHDTLERQVYHVNQFMQQVGRERTYV